MKIFKLFPSELTKFHLGDSNRKLKDYFSSDQLFSALYNCGMLLFNKDDSFFKELKETTFTSLFPGISIKFNEEVKDIIFLPKPLCAMEIGDKNVSRLVNHKKFKKIKFISFDLYKEMQKMWDDKEKEIKLDLSKVVIVGGTYACTLEELQHLQEKIDFNNVKLFKTRVVPKVVISRLNDTSDNFYFQDELEVNYYKARDVIIRPFFYFLCKEEVSSKFKGVVRLLADEGIGGKRSLSNGIFEEVLEGDFEEEIFNHSSGYYMNLSSIYPKKEEVVNLDCYELEERNGYIYSGRTTGIRKKTVRLIKEGSIFKDVISGRLMEMKEDVFKEHCIYLYGKGFLIPFGEVVK
ncbi:CRISPR-associated protein Csm4 [Anaerobranca californiensis DSM 14826]|uniref:CRISPR system Cms protein Csm4 n=1 Tax=Anaerobranca californiensis DSM 14826 TaxID=1120989 RepID=A0A1M6QKT7_9FIRM|nr:type III-A CRISPR-associated RAMP protein Csm4 [Anaerobranca californiensis]SHK20862.1 CRISPR-associated protein Csm4 [Anaerobranca californiensis DSM 14826]